MPDRGLGGWKLWLPAVGWMVVGAALALGLAGMSGRLLTAPAPPEMGGDPAAEIPPAAVLVGAGDIAVCGSSADEGSAALLDGIAGTVFTLGDNVYQDGTAADFANCYEVSWGRHKHRTAPAPGNHDYNTPRAAPYFAYFGAAAGDPSRGYYSYDLGAWHVIVINSNCREVGGCHAGSPQEQWLRADLAANPTACTLAYWHHPRFSSGPHGSDERLGPFWEALYEFGVDVVLSGHDHLYERFAPQDPGGVADPVRGIRQFTVGTGGAGLYGLKQVIANSEVRNDDTHGVLKLTLHPTGYDWEFVPVAGMTFSDTGSASCSAAGAHSMAARPSPTPTTAASVRTASPTAPTASAYRNTVLADRPQAYWRLGEAGGRTATDASGRDQDLTYSGVAHGVPGALEGDGDTAVGLAGDVSVYAMRTLFRGFPAAEASVEFWLRTDDGGRRGTPFSYASRDGFDNAFAVMNHRNFEIRVNNASTGPTGVSANDDGWHHIVVTWRRADGQAQLFKDGARVYVGSLQTGATIADGGTLVLGQDQDSPGGGFEGDQAFKGVLDEVAVYPYVLSSSRVQVHYGAGRTPGSSPAAAPR